MLMVNDFLSHIVPKILMDHGKETGNKRPQRPQLVQTRFLIIYSITLLLVKESTINPVTAINSLMGILECRWGYQFLGVIKFLMKIVKLSGAMEYSMEFGETE